jgi:hypothetical protein
MAGCARPTTSAETPLAPVATSGEAAPDATPPAKSDTGTPGRTKPAPPKSTPLPPERVDELPARVPKLVTSCATDADCVVKDVGSCCGTQPACVNKDSPVDPAAVQADCRARGTMSTCAFKPIDSCSCVAGACKANVMMTH